MKVNQSHGFFALGLQIIFFILFCGFVRYHPDADARHHPLVNATSLESKMEKYKSEDEWAHSKTYPMFQDVHVMIFIGFGFLMMFLKRYGLSAVGVNFLIGSLCLQWAILVNGFFHLKHGTIFLNLTGLLGADFTAAAVLISFGAMIGKVTPLQLMILVLVEIPIFAGNEVIGRNIFGAIDMGDSMFVHIFGAYFGMAASLMLHRRDAATEKEGSSYMSDKFAMIGTVFLWLYWPSFNAGLAPGDDQHRGIINTYISLVTCLITTFALSSIIHKEKKFDMVHVQNSTLAGGVAVGAAADLMIHPWGAGLIGILAAIISVLGYAYLSPVLASKLKLHDTCGVNNLHGMPGILAAIIAAICSALATEDTYGPSLYQIFPQRAPPEGSDELQKLRVFIPGLEAGTDRTASAQAGYQLLTTLVTIVLSIVGGLVAGLILRIKPLGGLKTEELYEDEKWWVMEEDADPEEELNKGGVTIPMNVAGSDNGTR